MMEHFALIGAAGYVAPRHMRAIKDTGNNLVAALDPFDSVGIIDNYFPQADFFVEFERFDRHLEKLKRRGVKVDFISVCSPNYLHDAHIRFGLRYGADVICEKPVVLNPWNVDALQEMEVETGRRVYNILQLRLHPSVIELKKRIDKEPINKVHDIELTYLTSRGHWYYTSWKGDMQKSGGIATNIGVHFFDMLIWIFGAVQQSTIHIHTHDRAAGFLKLEKARVRWFLGINYDLIPVHIRETGTTTYRSLTIAEDTFEFSGGFTDLHTVSYEEIIRGNGFTLSDTKEAIKVIHDIRSATPVGPIGNHHTLAELPVTQHPFATGISNR